MTFAASPSGVPGVLDPLTAPPPPRLTPRFRVLIHNDDVTPMDFVVMVLVDIFKKAFPEAMEIMLEAHNSGVALVTVLPFEEAEFRIDQAHSAARTAKYPLTLSLETE